MPEPVTMLGVVDSVEDLETAPSVAVLSDEHRAAQVPWPVRLRSAGLGVLLGLFAGAVVLTFALLPLGGWWPLVAAGLLGLALFLVLRRAPELDVRWVLAVAAGVLVALALAPLPGRSFGSSFFLCLAALLLAAIHVRAWRALAAVRADVLEWNAAYERLAEDPRRARVVRLSIRTEVHGERRRFVGDVTYADADGAEHTVPLVSAGDLQVHFPAETVLAEHSPAVVWHTPDHGVAHTVVLRDGA